MPARLGHPRPPRPGEGRGPEVAADPLVSAARGRLVSLLEADRSSPRRRPGPARCCLGEALAAFRL